MYIRTTADFARAAREARIAQGYTQRTFAERIHMSYSWVQRFERGELSPSLDAVIKVATSLHKNIALTDDTPDPVLDQLFRDLQ